MIDDVYYAFYKKDITDKRYGDQYKDLFPDIDNPEIPPYMEDIGDEFLSTNDFIDAVIDAYDYLLKCQQLSDKEYEPPKIEEICDEIYMLYENSISEVIDDIYNKEMETRGQELTEEESNNLYDIINEEMYEQYVNTIACTTEEKIMRVLDFYKLVYIGEDFVSKEDCKGYNSYTKIFNSSQTTLFEMNYSDVWNEGGCYDDNESIERGYCNLLRAGMDIL